MKINRLLASLILGLLLFCTFGFKACENATPIRRIANASDDIANSVDKGRRMVNKLVADSLITKAEANDVRRSLIDVSNLTDEFAEKARLHQKVDPVLKGELDKWLADLRDANLKLIANGTYHIKNEKVRGNVSAAVSGISSLISTIATLVRSIKVEPAPVN